MEERELEDSTGFHGFPEPDPKVCLQLSQLILALECDTSGG